MKIALVSFNPTVGDISGNAQKMLGFIDAALEKKSNLIIFPELSLLGYPPRDLLYLSPLLLKQQAPWLTLFKRKSKKIAIILGGISKNKDRGCALHNTAFAFINGSQYVYHKILLPNYDVFDECRYFEPGRVPLVLKIGGYKIGLTICEDIWGQDPLLKNRYHINPLTFYAKKKLDFIVNISASPYEMDKMARRETLIKQTASQLKTGILYTNQCGANDDLIFDGGCLVTNAHGECLLKTNPFHEDWVIFDTENPPQNQKNRSIPSEKQKIQNSLSALILGIGDYFKKTGHHKAVLGLSGGIDSALVAYLACQALGSTAVTGLLLPSRYSSEGSISDALALAKNLEMPTATINIDSVHQSFEKNFTTLFGKTGTQDLTQQNIQARIRGSLLMAYANNTGALLLNTTNKSEMAMGYGTLYGDLCGALAVLSDVPKTLVYEMVAVINNEKEIIPQTIVTKAPSAELKSHQKDTDSLPPYEELDPILHEWIDNQTLPESTPSQQKHLNDLLSQIMRNEYKRHQAPLGLKISRKAFGSGRRYPIAMKWRWS